MLAQHCVGGGGACPSERGLCSAVRIASPMSIKVMVERQFDEHSALNVDPQASRTFACATCAASGRCTISRLIATSTNSCIVLVGAARARSFSPGISA